MGNRVLWPRVSSEDATPLTSGPRQRPLRLTLHTDSLALADRRNADALRLLYELSSLPELDLQDFEGTRCSCIRIKPQPSAHGYYGLSVQTPAGEIVSLHEGIHPSRVGDRAVSLIFDMPHSGVDGFGEARQHLFCLEAHFSLVRDVFVTLSPFILSHKDTLDYANPMSPLEASHLTGLVLRARNNWVYRKSEKASFATDQGMFYWVLMRTKLPSFWRYLGGLGASRGSHGDNLVRLGQSVVERCYRALQARDEIAVQHYIPQNNNTRDLMMYHFDYLTLLLGGAWDAQASVVNEVYELGVDDWNRSFRKQIFQESLRASGSSTVLEIVNCNRSENLMVMLHKLRNTIHSTGLSTFGYLEPSQPEASYATIPREFRDELLAAAGELGGADEWGVKRKDSLMYDPQTDRDEPSYDVFIEPLSYATHLIDDWFEIFDAIAAATEVDRLFPDGRREAFGDAPPEDWAEMIDRFPLLAP